MSPPFTDSMAGLSVEREPGQHRNAIAYRNRVELSERVVQFYPLQLALS
jgi:hypothetical protein